MKSTDDELVGATDGGSCTESAVAQAARLSNGMAPKAVYIRESSVENYLRKLAKQHADKCMLEKHVSPGRRGVPDDLITWGSPLCTMHLIETKAPLGKRKDYQKRDHDTRAKYGIIVYTLFTKADVDTYFNSMLRAMELI